MRALTVLLLATPTQAWDFSPTPVCTILNDTPTLQVRVTYDPSQAQPYAISLTRPDPWPATDTFGVLFGGGVATTIVTSRHTLSNDGRTLTVTDTGFGNVLNGLASNNFAMTLAEGEPAIPFDLTGARPAVEAFKACGEVPST